MSFKYNQRVRTPEGLVGYTDAKIVGTTKYLVSYARSEHTPEEWQRIAGHGGPSVVREFEESDLVAEPGIAKIVNPYRPRPASWTDVVQGAEKTMKSKPSSMNYGAGDAARIAEAVQEGTVWRSKGGYIYRIWQIVGETAYLDGVGFSEKREMSKRNVFIRYTPVPEDEVPRTVKKERVERPRPSTASAASPDTSSVVLDSLWSSRRNGDLYRVVSINGGLAKLSWLAGKYTRDVTISTVAKYYTPFVGEVTNGS